MFNTGSRPTGMKSVVESADSGLESADYSADSNINSAKVGVWVRDLSKSGWRSSVSIGSLNI